MFLCLLWPDRQFDNQIKTYEKLLDARNQCKQITCLFLIEA